MTNDKVQGILKLIPKGQSPKIYVDLVKRQVLGVDKSGKDRPEEDLMLFLYTCKRVGLDPITKQIHAIYRWDTNLGREKLTIQAGIDGLRVVAQRTGEYGGSDDMKFMPEDEKAEHPDKATCTVYKVNKKTGDRMPISASARWNEYAPKDEKMGFMWRKMPYAQLGKCAEALALRKAFPNILSGVYSEDEMQQAGYTLADLPEPKKEDKETPTPVNTDQIDIKKMRDDLKEGKDGDTN